MTNLCSWVAMMIRVSFMFLDLVRKISPNRSFGHSLTDPRIQLAHLGSLTNFIAQSTQCGGSFNCPSTSRSPDCEGFERCIRTSSINQFLSLLIPVSHKRFSHLLCIFFAFLRKLCVCLEGIFFFGRSGLNEVNKWTLKLSR